MWDRRLLSQFDVDDIRLHAQDEGLACLEVERRSSDSAPYASFRVRVSLASAGKALSSNLWPQGAVVRRFYSPRSKKPQGTITGQDNPEASNNGTTNKIDTAHTASQPEAGDSNADSDNDTNEVDNDATEAKLAFNDNIENDDGEHKD